MHAIFLCCFLQAYEDALAAQTSTTKQLNSLLQRKSSWSEEDVGHFARLCKQEHGLEHGVGGS